MANSAVDQSLLSMHCINCGATKGHHKYSSNECPSSENDGPRFARGSFFNSGTFTPKNLPPSTTTDRTSIVLKFVRQNPEYRHLIVCDTIKQVKLVSEDLKSDFFHVAEMIGSAPRADRFSTIEQLHEGVQDVLVGTKQLMISGWYVGGSRPIAFSSICTLSRNEVAQFTARYRPNSSTDMLCCVRVRTPY